MLKRSLVAVLILGLTSPAFAADLQQSIAAQATLLARASSSQAPARADGQVQAPPGLPQGRSNKESKILMVTGIGLAALGATLITYGNGGFGNCAGSPTSTQVYSTANECYSDKVTGWMLGVGAGSVLILGSIFTHKK